ncbi:MAG: TIGR01212 family radical SAM protein [Sulfurospirillaceae bacterium]|nr:TIGR01212 family radical SAM protein [Sulfurospirillaceae bacterium]
MHAPFLTYKNYMLEHYGEALYSIPVDLKFGCPNRNKDDRGGCTFCPEDGARAAQTKEAKSMEEQIEHAIAFAQKRYNAKAFALYIQAYTGTFASLIQQQKIYEKLLKIYPFKAIYIGTRPDCLSDETLDYLQELDKSIEVHIELGIQSMHDATLRSINRGHNAQKSKEAIERLHARHLKVHAHLILGFPNESMCHWQESVDILVEQGIDGIKFHNLHIIKHTALAQQYAQIPFHTMDEYEYAEALIDLLRRIPSSIPILRLATDTPDKDLIAPLWKISKNGFSKYFVKTMYLRGIFQGDLMEPKKNKNNEIRPQIILKDGSTTFFNHEFKDYYHPKEGALRQAEQLFVAKSHLKKRLEGLHVRLLDIGFGMGYNSFSALKMALNLGENSLHVSAIEHDKMLLLQSAQVIAEPLHVKMLEGLYAQNFWTNGSVHIELLNADARYAIRFLKERFDVIFLDPFLESNNPTLISVEFLQKLHLLLKTDGVLVCSASLRSVHVALIEAGFEVEIVAIDKTDIVGFVAKPTSEIKKIEGIAYHDPYLVWSDKEIARQRDEKLKTKG